MGGKNHAPCKGYMLNSTQMSRAHSLAGILLEKMNVALEDALLAEMGGDPTKPFAVGVELNAFKHALVGLHGSIDVLRKQMRDENYFDLAPINTAEIDIAGGKMASLGMVSHDVFKQVLAIYRGKTFYGVLDVFDGHIHDIQDIADELGDKVEVCRMAYEAGSLEDELEENRAGNLRPEFARLYTAWNQFNNFFLASSLISTEAYYRNQRIGSLLDHVTTETPAPATA